MWVKKIARVVGDLLLEELKRVGASHAFHNTGNRKKMNVSGGENFTKTRLTRGRGSICTNQAKIS